MKWHFFYGGASFIRPGGVPYTPARQAVPPIFSMEGWLVPVRPMSDSPEPAERRPGTPQRLAYLYRRRLIETNREDRFLVWASFTASFLTVRFITHSIRAGRFRRVFHNVTGTGGRHIHHLVFGIAGLLAGGFVMAARHPAGADARRALALLYGLSAALTIDEFALWLDLEDVYWAKQGRLSVDAAIVTAALMGASVAGRPLLLALARDAAALWRRARQAKHGPLADADNLSDLAHTSL